jgi:hypothetical protein
MMICGSEAHAETELEETELLEEARFLGLRGNWA